MNSRTTSSWILKLIPPLLLVAGAAQAQVDPPGPVYAPHVELSVSGSSNLDLYNDVEIRQPDGSYVLSGTDSGMIGGAPAWQLEWNLFADAYRGSLVGLLAGSMSLTNESSIARDFVVTVWVRTWGSARTSWSGGNASVLLEDADGDGSASLSRLSNGLTPTILFGYVNSDLSPGMRLFALGLGCDGAGCEASSTEDSLFHPGVFTSIAIGTRYAFNLSAGDRVTFDSSFAVSAVPLPAALPLFLLGLAPLYQAATRRRLNQANNTSAADSTPAIA